MTFTHWFNKVDNLVARELGVSIHDLPDMDFQSAFDAGISPEDFADEVCDDAISGDF